MIQYVVYGFMPDFTPFCQLFSNEDRAYAYRDHRLKLGATVHITFAKAEIAR